MHIDVWTGWAVAYPYNNPSKNRTHGIDRFTVADTRKDAILAAVKEWCDCGFSPWDGGQHDINYCWKKLYRSGFRCVKVRTVLRGSS